MDLVEARKKAKELKKKLEEEQSEKPEQEKKSKKARSEKKTTASKKKKPKKKKEVKEKAPVKEKEEQKPTPPPFEVQETEFEDLSFGEDLPEVSGAEKEFVLEQPVEKESKQQPLEKPEPEPAIKPKPLPEPEPEIKAEEQEEKEAFQPEPSGITFELEGEPEKDFYDLIVEDLVQYGYGEVVEENILELLSFQLADEIYAVPLINIQQIIKPRPITFVPRAPHYILGIISLRGAIIPIFDLKRRLGLGETEVQKKSRIIIINLNEKVSAGLLVDQVLEVARVPEESIEPPPPIFSGVEGEFLNGIARYKGKMLIILNLNQVVLGHKEEALAR